MKLNKTILAAVLASSIFMGAPAQATSPACNQAWDDLIALMSFYGTSWAIINGVPEPISRLSPLGRTEIAQAQTQVTLYCEHATIGLSF